MIVGFFVVYLLVWIGMCGALDAFSVSRNWSACWGALVALTGSTALSQLMRHQ